MPLLQLFNVLCILWKADRHDRNKLIALFRLYGKLERDTRNFRKRTGLRCEIGCGCCCEHPDIETTIFELIPLAIYLWKKDQSGTVLEKTKQADHKGRCIFYAADPLVKGKGRCTVYPWRPLSCRLFGFSARSDKNEKLELVTCPTIKTLFPKEFEKARNMIARGESVPKNSDYVIQAAQLDQVLGRERVSINKAISMALDKVGLWRQLRSR